MKKTITLFLLLFSFYAKSQDVIFCERVDPSGKAVNESRFFKISPKGGFFDVLVKLSRPVQSQEVVFDIYHKSNGKEDFINSVRMKINPFATWFYKEITFYLKGEYVIYVFDEKDKLLGTGSVKIGM